MSIVIIDDFSGEYSFHGKEVKKIVEHYYDGEIIIIDTGSPELSWSEIYQILETCIDEFQDITAVNMSYGGGETDIVKFWNDIEEWYNLFKSYFEKQIYLFFPAGNESEYLPNYDGVSILASSPFVVSTSAVEINDNKIEIPSWAEYDENMVDCFMEGTSLNGDIGTSFSSPRACAFYANLLEDGFTFAEVEAVYKKYSEPVRGNDNNWYWYLDLDKVPKNITVDTDDAKLLITDLYYLICGRRPDPGGLDYWTDVLEEKDINKVIEAFIYEAEKNQDTDGDNVTVRAKIEAVYEFFFDRFADNGGLAYWIDEALHSDTWDDIIMKMYYAGKQNGEEIRFEEFFDDVLVCNDTAYIEIDSFLI